MSRREDNTKALAKGAAERDANAPEDQTGTVTMLKLQGTAVHTSMLFPPDIYGYAEFHKAKFQNPNFSVTRGCDWVCLAFIFQQDLSKAYKCISIKLG